MHSMKPPVALDIYIPKITKVHAITNEKTEHSILLKI